MMDDSMANCKELGELVHAENGVSSMPWMSLVTAGYIVSSIPRMSLVTAGGGVSSMPRMGFANAGGGQLNADDGLSHCRGLC
jgi:hypothetical protein